MKLLGKTSLVLLGWLSVTSIYLLSCQHENELLVSNGTKIERGTQKLTLTDTKVSFDKTHSNVMWETAYMGGLSLLTGRFDTLAFNSFNFDEANPAGTSFEAWVWINRVNTSEPGRDKGCLQTTFGVNTSMTSQTENVAIIKSKSVELSPNDKGYIVKCDLTFHGVTKEITGKLTYDGQMSSGSGATLKYNYGFSFDFQILAKTDFLIASTSIADKVTIRCNAIFRQVQ
jgi:polyisoprenoid-binding protein YceI